MTQNKTHSEIISAETKSIGFDYQYYFFLWKLLSLNDGESVGLEVKDDVHTELNNSEQIFYQVKHTIKQKSDGTAVNLTASDIDLWKTLSNWVHVITDKNDNRELKSQQLNFIKKTSFVLASNKSSSGNNQIIEAILNLQLNKKSIGDTKTEFQSLFDKSTSGSVKEYIKDLQDLDEKILLSFLLKLFFELDEKDIIKKCKNAIKSDKIDINKIDTVFSKIDSAIRQDNFINIKNGEKIEISFDDFYLKYRRHYDLARNSSLTITEFAENLPEKLEDQIFIKQLLEIEDVDPNDIESIAGFTRFKLKLQNNMHTWIQNGELTVEEKDNFKKDAINQWRNKHRSTYRGETTDSACNKLGLEVLDKMREESLNIADQPLKTDMSNGTFYDLSDTPHIGWRKDWKKYKK